MITTEGKIHIKRYLAGQVPSIAQSIAYGLGASAESAAQTYLDFEVDRSDIILTSYDFVNNKLIFKAEVPEKYDGTVYEVALFSLPANTASGNFGSKLLSTFDSETEEWTTGGVAATFSSGSARIGGDALRQAPTASTTVTSILEELSLDLSGNSDADKFALAFNNANTNTNTIVIRFKTDASNYYSLTFTNPAAGYVVSQINKGSATVTGSPSWADINTIEVATTAKSSGTATVDIDAIRIEDVDTVNVDYVMISRELLAVPFVKEQGKVKEIEFSIDVNV